MKYKEYEIDITTINYSHEVAIFTLPTGEVVCLPEQDATPEELDLIKQIKEVIESRLVKQSEEGDGYSNGLQNHKKNDQKKFSRWFGRKI